MEEWFPIEKSPEVFTQLINNLGVKGVHVEEILSFDSLENSNNPIYGLIFISKYIKNIIETPNIISNYDKDLFFSKQLLENQNATQALLSIILNNEDKIEIGQNLKEIKLNMNEMDYIKKGIFLSNCEILKKEHNKFKILETNSNDEDDDIYHFVTFIHFKNAIYEIDGLREGPILIEENIEFKDWISKVIPYLKEKINLFSNNEIKFNLMALTLDKLELLKTNKEKLLKQKNFIEEKIKGNEEISKEKIFEELNGMNKEQLEKRLEKIETEINDCNNGINIEKMKINKYKEEKERRQFNYNPLIFELLKIMGENGIIKEAYNQTFNEQK